MRVREILRALLSPRVGTGGSAATSAPPPHHVPIGIETHAVWSEPVPLRDAPTPRDPDPGRRATDR